MLCDAVSGLLELESDIEVLGKFPDGRAALDSIEHLKPDLVLTDIEMPELNGIELIEKIVTHYPSIKTVIMTTFSRSGYIRRALNAGVGGFVLKESPSAYLVDAIRRVMVGQRVIESELALHALDDNDPLADKERKALRMAGEGLRAAEISSALHLTEGTVRNYLSSAITKLNAGNSVDAARIAEQKGWL